MLKAKLVIQPLVFILSVMLTSVSSASQYDPILLKAQAALFPKIVMLDKNIKQKLAGGGEIALAIVHETSDVRSAEKLKQLIDAKYKGTLAKQSLSIQLVDISSYEQLPTATAYFVLNSRPERIQKLASWTAAANRMLFSYDFRAFEQQSLVSLILKEKTYIYLNKAALPSYNIKFQNLFFRIAKVFE